MSETPKDRDESPRRVYLDTADWSYLEEGRDPESERVLRDLGEVGDACFVVTFDHLVEISGLESGRGSRVAYLQNFPGTVLLSVSGIQVLSTSTRNFVAQSLGLSTVTLDLPTQRMRDLSVASLLDEIDKFRMWREVQGIGARLETSSMVGTTKKKRESKNSLMRVARKGSVAMLREHIMREETFRPGIRGLVQVGAMHALVKLQGWMAQNGIGIPATRREQAFERLIVPSLPREIRRSSTAMSTLRTSWKNEAATADVSPAVACSAAIEVASNPSKDPVKFRSSENDKHHAAFAAMMHVFTCDKRVQPSVDSTLRAGRRAVRVIRTQRLHEVVAAVRESLRQPT